MDNPELLAFEEAIKGMPYDMDLRKVFADWLDEHDMSERATREREWTVEKQKSWEWFESLANEMSGGTIYPNGYDTDGEPDIFTAQRLIDLANKYVDNNLEVYVQIGSQWARDTFNELADDFWNHFQVLTGRNKPENDELGWPVDHSFIGCTC